LKRQAVKWNDYIEVHNQDKLQLANKRVCPRITEKNMTDTKITRDYARIFNSKHIRRFE